MALHSLILATFGAAFAGAPTAPDLRVLRALPDPFALETAMERTGLVPRSTSALFGQRALGSRIDGSPVEIAAVGWMRLDGVSVIEPEATRGLNKRRTCARLRGHDPVPGDRRVVPVNPRRGVGVPEVSDGPPTLILANGDDGEYALLQLQPGDVLQVTDIEHKGERSEHIEVRRGDQLLTVDRRGSGAQVCYAPDVQRRAEWLPD